MSLGNVPRRNVSAEDARIAERLAAFSSIKIESIGFTTSLADITFAGVPYSVTLRCGIVSSVREMTDRAVRSNTKKFRAIADLVERAYRARSES